MITDNVTDLLSFALNIRLDIVLHCQVVPIKCSGDGAVDMDDIRAKIGGEKQDEDSHHNSLSNTL